MILPRLRSMKYELSIYETVSIFDLPTITAQDNGISSFSQAIDQEWLFYDAGIRLLPDDPK